MTGPRILLTISRTWCQISNLRRVLGEIHARYPDAVLVHGNAPQGDQTAAAIWRQLGGTDEPWPAEWKKLGKRAGMVRNARMVESNPALCVAFIRAASAGASHCAALAEGAGIPTVRYTHEETCDA